MATITKISDCEYRIGGMYGIHDLDSNYEKDPGSWRPLKTDFMSKLFNAQEISFWYPLEYPYAIHAVQVQDYHISLSENEYIRVIQLLGAAGCFDEYFIKPRYASSGIWTQKDHNWNDKLEECCCILVILEGYGYNNSLIGCLPVHNLRKVNFGELKKRISYAIKFDKEISDKEVLSEEDFLAIEKKYNKCKLPLTHEMKKALLQETDIEKMNSLQLCERINKTKSDLERMNRLLAKIYIEEAMIEAGLKDKTLYYFRDEIHYLNGADCSVNNQGELQYVALHTKRVLANGRFSPKRQWGISIPTEDNFIEVLDQKLIRKVKTVNVL